MKRFFGVLVAVLLVSFPLLVLSADFRVNERPSLQSGETVNEDLYMVGGSITSSGRVNGDLITTGGNAVVGGRVNGDVLAAGGNITITGDVADDLRAGGGTILVQGSVNGDLVLGGGQIQVTGPRVLGDVAIGGGVIRIDSPVSGKVLIGGGDVYLNSAIQGNVRVQADKLTLGPNAVLAGDLTYTASKEVVLEPGAVVRGKTTFTEHAPWGEKGFRFPGAIFGIAFYKIISTFIASLLLALYFKRYAKELVAIATENPWGEMGRGLVIAIVLPILSVLLLVTVIGIPLGLIGLIATAALALFVCLVAPIILGSVVHRWITKKTEYHITWGTVLLGTILYVALGFIPFIGWILNAFVALLTLGAMTRIKWNVAKTWR